MGYSLTVKKIIPISISVLLTSTLASVASAHHSRSNFDLDTQLEFSGVVTEYTWRNPHTFATLAVEDQSGTTKELLFELNSVSVMTRAGWTRNTINVGDRVTVVANPDHDANKNLYYANYWMLPDGSTMYSSGGGTVGPSGPAIAQEPAQSRPDNKAFSEDFSGIWRMYFNRGGGGNPSQMSLGGQGPAVGIPLTALGQEVFDAYNAAENPWFSCISRTPPWILVRGAGAHRFTRQNGKLHIRHEINDVDRIIHLDMTEHPSDTKPSHLGHSIGRFEGETLVVETAHFAPAKWGNGGGIPSSDQKHLIERFTLAEDGRALDYQYSITDPVYLSETVALSTQLSLDADYPFQEEYGCDPGASSRHLNH